MSEPVKVIANVQSLGIGWLIALIALIVAIVAMFVGKLDLVTGGFIAALALSRLT